MPKLCVRIRKFQFLVLFQYKDNLKAYFFNTFKCNIISNQIAFIFGVCGGEGWGEGDKFAIKTYRRILSVFYLFIFFLIIIFFFYWPTVHFMKIVYVLCRAAVPIKIFGFSNEILKKSFIEEEIYRTNKICALATNFHFANIVFSELFQKPTINFKVIYKIESIMLDRQACFLFSYLTYKYQ